jgi:hypothetical protein
MFPCYDTRCHTNRNRRFFPSTEPEPDEEWEEVEAGESAENGPAGGATGKVLGGEEEGTSKVELPDVPTGEPMSEGPAVKKQKPNDEEKL